MSDAAPSRGGRPMAVRGKTARRYAEAKLTHKRREFAEILMREGLTLEQAAERVGVKRDTAAQWLRMASVLEVMEAERKAVLAGERGRNIAALAEIRSESKNAMARVAAVRELEGMAADAGLSKTAHNERPGYVIAIPQHLMERLQAAGGAMPKLPPSMTPAPVIEGEVIEEGEA